ncbi:uncharacterized protein LOC106165433 [Lingula anatina]|uniref:Uncharacterized protein LOC106165433 n=1 Tax=Lingula anatina TaxID=7574 RepID=A0A1S3ILZ0_LINAN|nr:uncharacterized protein LOC106165433 [Lingula anatina]|eukprot:XP_013399093.1 uncharacterized protein LOC106165433 [Lingula anatina]
MSRSLLSITPRLFQPYRCLKQQSVKLKKHPRDYPKITGNELWRRKFRTLFQYKDVNKDGYLKKVDYEMSAWRIIQYMDLSGEMAADVMETQLQMWEYITANAPYMEGITLNDFTENCLKAYNEENTRFGLITACCSEFDALDLDANGVISPKEHAAFFYSYFVPAEHSPPVFRAMDTDSDGVITKAEFVQGMIDFLLSEDPKSPYVNFFGPLAN